MFPRKDDLLSKRMSTEFVRSNSWTTAWQNMTSMYQSLPALRSFWPLTTYVDRGVGNDPQYTFPDFAGAAYHMRIHTIGLSPPAIYPPQISLYRGVTPVIPSAYLRTADYPGLNLTGTEDIGGVNRGITFGLWTYTDTKVSERGTTVFFGKGGYDLKDNQYMLNYVAANYNVNFIIGNGSTFDWITSTDELAQPSQANFILGRYTVAAGGDKQLSLFINGRFWKKATTESVGKLAYDVYSQHANGTLAMNGWNSMMFICACALPDSVIQSLYHSTRPYYGVK